MENVVLNKLQSFILIRKALQINFLFYNLKCIVNRTKGKKGRSSGADL
jgi:hypothetical protein